MRYTRIRKTENGCGDCIFNNSKYDVECFNRYKCAYSDPKNSCMEGVSWEYIFIKAKELSPNIKVI